MADRDFPAALKAAAAAVERFLDGVLAETGAPAERRLVAAMRHGALGGGKRLRPFLVAEAGRLFDAPDVRTLRAGAALECLHCYSLVHDDLPAMDDDALRRGQPTVHVAFDEATAILAGDALLTLAFGLLADPDTHPDGAVRAALVAGLADAAGHRGMVGGQALDIAAETGAIADEAGIVRMQARKTGALIGFAVAAGAILGGAGERERTALETYARHFGLAFQIADDLLDAEGAAETVGKATGKDAAAGKATFVGLLGAEGARRRLDEEVGAALSALSPFGGRAGRLADAARFVADRRS